MHNRPSVSGTVRLLAFLWLTMSALAAPVVSQQVLKQDPLPPFDIEEYTVEPTTTADGESAYRHKVVIEDEMMQSVVAAEFVFVGNDGFTVQSLHRGTMKERVDLHERASGTWTTPAGSASEFAVLVEKARFLDGEMWNATHEDMAQAIGVIDPDFEAWRLQNEPQRAVVIELEIDVE